MPFENNFKFTNIVLVEDNVAQTDVDGNPITTRIFKATKTIKITFLEEHLRLEKRQIERTLVWINDVLDQMAVITTITP